MVGALLLYMAFLMLVDPLTRKPDAYTEQLHNEQEDEVLTGSGAGPAPPPLGLPPCPSPVLPLSVPRVTQTPVFSSLGTGPPHDTGWPCVSPDVRHWAASVTAGAPSLPVTLHL